MRCQSPPDTMQREGRREKWRHRRRRRRRQLPPPFLIPGGRPSFTPSLTRPSPNRTKRWRPGQGAAQLASKERERENGGRAPTENTEGCRSSIRFCSPSNRRALLFSVGMREVARACSVHKTEGFFFALKRLGRCKDQGNGVCIHRGRGGARRSWGLRFGHENID